MAGEVNLRKLKEVASYFYIKKKGTGFTPTAMKHLHEFFNECPDVVKKGDIHYMTGTAISIYELEE